MDEDEATIDDPGFLMEVMEVHESIDCAELVLLQHLEEEYKHKEEECIKASSSLVVIGIAVCLPFMRCDTAALSSKILRLQVQLSSASSIL